MVVLISLNTVSGDQGKHLGQKKKDGCENTVFKMCLGRHVGLVLGSDYECSDTKMASACSDIEGAIQCLLDNGVEDCKEDDGADNDYHVAATEFQAACNADPNAYCHGLNCVNGFREKLGDCGKDNGLGELKPPITAEWCEPLKAAMECGYNVNSACGVSTAKKQNSLNIMLVKHIMAIAECPIDRK